MSNPNDIIRDAILRYLYRVHKKARSPKTAAQGIRDIAKGMKQFGYKLQEMASNLDYLIQKGWVREVVEQRTFTTERGTTQNSEKRSYKISDTGIDKLEAASVYQRASNESRINITNISGVTVVGDGNVVNTNFTDLSRTLDDLKQTVFASRSILGSGKLNARLPTLILCRHSSKNRNRTRLLLNRLGSYREGCYGRRSCIELAQKSGRYLRRYYREGLMLTAIRVGNFKAFAESQRIPLRPLTLIFGANSSGKSSILHSLILARHAQDTGELDVHRTTVGGESVDLGGFRQFVHRRDVSRRMEWSAELDTAFFAGRLAGMLAPVKYVQRL